MYPEIASLHGVLVALDHLITSGEIKVGSNPPKRPSLQSEGENLLRLAGQLSAQWTRSTTLALSIIDSAAGQAGLSSETKETLAGLGGILDGRDGGDYVPIPRPYSRPRLPNDPLFRREYRRARAEIDGVVLSALERLDPRGNSPKNPGSRAARAGRKSKK